MFNPDYTVGLVDGEGSFTVYLRSPDKRGTVKRRVIAEPKFYVKLIERDKHILCGLQKFFGCGSIYFQKDTRPRHQNCYRYEVFRWDDLKNVIIPFFRKHPLQFPSKRNDFKLFCRVMEKLAKKEHLSISGLKRLQTIKQQMH